MTSTGVVKTTYTDADVERGLQAIAFYGSTYKAEKLMDQPIPRATLDKWKVTHSERYLEIRNNTLAHTRQRQAVGYDDLANRALEVAHRAINQVERDLKAGNIKNPHDAAHKLTAAAAQATDKASLLRGLPTQLTITADATELLSDLARLLPSQKPADANTTAQEIPT